MNRQVGRLCLASVCLVAAIAAAQAQPPADSVKSSHRPLDSAIGDLNGAEAFLARRLRHTHDVQEMQDLLQPLLKDKNFQKILKDKLSNGQDLANLKDALKNHPELLDDPALHDMLKSLEPLKRNGQLTDLPKDTQDALAQRLKDFVDKRKTPEGSPDKPPLDMPPDGSPPPDLTHDASTPKTLPPVESQPNWMNRDVLDSMNRVFKDMGKSPEADSLRSDILRELGKMDAGPSGSSAGLADFLKNVITSEDAAWLAQNLKLPEGPKLGGLPSGPSLPAGPTVGAGSTAGALDGVVWIAALVLLGVSAYMVFTMMRKQAAAARARAWSAGPWPVDPSQVSTREDLIRAFEHLAFLLLGPVARPLNHLDVAARMGGTDHRRAHAAARLAHLYEQARYAPPNELLPENELTAARGDLSALAGAAA